MPAKGSLTTASTDVLECWRGQHWPRAARALH